MTKKQKIVADYMVGCIKWCYTTGNIFLKENMEKATNLSDLCNAMEIGDGELVFNGAMEAHYSISTLNEINRGDVAGFRIWDAVKDYVWNEWLKLK